MEFTFGICASRSNKDLHQTLARSIHLLNIPNYEILFIGDIDHVDSKSKVIYFDESQKEGWITKKKNILCQNANFENIVLLHDYIEFEANWYKGFLNFGNDFDIAMNVILNNNNTRFRDWCLNPFDIIPPKGPVVTREFFLPYNVTHLTNLMYISGTYWVAKTKFMLDNPLDEDLTWGQSEDLKWSEQVRSKTQFKMNTNSIVRCMKLKYCDFTEISPENLMKIEALSS